MCKTENCTSMLYLIPHSILLGLMDELQKKFSEEKKILEEEMERQIESARI